MKRISFLLIVGISALNACVSYNASRQTWLRLSTSVDHSAPISEYKRYAMWQSFMMNGFDPMLSKEVVYKVEESVRANSYQVDPIDADFLVSVVMDFIDSVAENGQRYRTWYLTIYAIDVRAMARQGSSKEDLMNKLETTAKNWQLRQHFETEMGQYIAWRGIAWTSANNVALSEMYGHMVEQLGKVLLRGPIEEPEILVPLK